MPKFWRKDGKLLWLPDRPGVLMYSDECCCDGTGLHHEFLRCETLELIYIQFPKLNSVDLDPPTVGSIYKYADYSCWEYIREIECPTGGNCIQNRDFISVHSTCADCNSSPRCVDIERCDDGLLYQNVLTSMVLGDWFSKEARCHKVITEYPICPGVPGAGPGIDFMLPNQTECIECRCGCYETDEDMPPTITVIISNSGCGMDGTYTANRTLFGCEYVFSSPPTDGKVTLGRDNNNGTPPGTAATGEVNNGFNTCYFKGLNQCGSQTLTYDDTGAGIPSGCCNLGATMEIIVP